MVYKAKLEGQLRLHLNKREQRIEDRFLDLI
jgi:hypothetical protein